MLPTVMPSKSSGVYRLLVYRVVAMSLLVLAILFGVHLATKKERAPETSDAEEASPRSVSRPAEGERSRNLLLQRRVASSEESAESKELREKLVQIAMDAEEQLSEMGLGRNRDREKAEARREKMRDLHAIEDQEERDSAFLAYREEEREQRKLEAESRRGGQRDPDLNRLRKLARLKVLPSMGSRIGQNEADRDLKVEMEAELSSLANFGDQLTEAMIDRSLEKMRLIQMKQRNREMERRVNEGR